MTDIETGADRHLNTAKRLEARAPTTIPIRDQAKVSRYMVALPFDREKMRKRAACLSLDGHIITLFDYDATAKFHRVTFSDDGYWVHTGGIFGRELRSEPLLQAATRKKRVHRTLKRLAGIRAKRALLPES